MSPYYDCVGDTSSEGSYLAGASPCGALDMAGNVQEWAVERAQRGGGWLSDGGGVRSPDRLWWLHILSIGFHEP